MKTTKVKLSIICPIYNAEKYISKMLTSLQSQTYKDFEAICVLDAPTDGTAKIVRDFAQKDERFRIIENKENLHAGMSRNVGIDHALGEFVGFVDADDYCQPNMYEELLTIAMSRNADWVISQPTTLYQDGSTKTYRVPSDVEVQDIRNCLIFRGGGNARYPDSAFCITGFTEKSC